MAQKLVFLDSSVQDAKARIKALDTTTSGGHNWDSSDNPFYYSVVFGANGHLYTHGVDFNCIDHFAGQNGVPVITTANNITTVSYYTVNNSNPVLSETNTNNRFVTENIIKQAIDNAVSTSIASAFKYKGTYTAASSASNTVDTTKFSDFGTQASDVKIGWTWKVNGSGYFGNQAVEPGDTIIAIVDNPGSTESNYNVIQTNIDWAGLSNNVLTIKSGDTTISTYNPTTTGLLQFIGGTNVTLTPNSTNHTITIASTNTWRPFKYQNGSNTAVDMLGNGTDTGTLTFKGGDNVALAYDSTNKILTFTSTNTWRPVYAYLISANSGTELLSSTNTSALNFGQEFAYTDADAMTGSEIHLVWAEVSSSTVTYHV